MKHRKGRDSISDLNAAATLPATRTNEPRSHVLVFYSVLLELKQLESFKLVSVSFNTVLQQLTRPSRPGPCLDFGFQYAFIRKNRPNKFGVAFRVLPGSKLRWWPCIVSIEQEKSAFF